MAHHATYSMAVLMGVGGVMGYAKKKSVASLVAGVSLGIGFGVAGKILQDGHMQLGHATSLGLSTVTMAAMGLRAIKTKKKLPTAIASIAAVSSAYHAKRFMDWFGQE